jgi:hypothetical protein
MSVALYSRYTFCTAQKDEDGRLYLSRREPYRYRNLADNRVHRVAQGDTLQSLAARYFAGMPRPAGLYWVIADFQPDPIIDPTIALVPGSHVFIPSVRTVLERVFAEARRYEENV